MKNGWELGMNEGLISKAWLQKNGLHKGGEIKNIHLNTLYSMLNKKLIIQKEKQSNDPYWLIRYVSV